MDEIEMLESIRRDLAALGASEAESTGFDVTDDGAQSQGAGAEDEAAFRATRGITGCAPRQEDRHCRRLPS